MQSIRTARQRQGDQTSRRSRIADCKNELQSKKMFEYSILALLIIISSIVFYYAASRPFGICVESTTNTTLEKTVAALDSTVSLGLTLSTSLIGLSAAVLIGFKSDIVLTRPKKLIILIAVIFFVESALYGIWWRLGIANAWLNECLNIIEREMLQTQYQLHFGFFMFGLLALGALVAISALSEKG